ncbi:hypothetical protein MNBD_GAMMA03-865 [hydrothermal vent metagenome]|uniref:Uncharacterized protein n=1 Tax=hydrothermal vent metagenome TaxID=652676 RepID=A0A3B0VLA6_9ZZZZ
MNRVKSIILVLLLQTSFFSFLTVAGEPFVYGPISPSAFKQIKVDEHGITVVVDDGQIVTYNLDHSRSLQWLIKDSFNISIVDTVITENSIYILHLITGGNHLTAVSKYSRTNGTLLWRKTVDDFPGQGIHLVVNEDINSLVVAGMHEQMIQVWWYDTGGIFQAHWGKDLAIFTGPLGSENELIYAIKLLDDKSVISLSITFQENIVRVIHTDIAGNELFDYSHQAHDIVTHGTPPSLLEANNNQFVITFIDENLLGVPRFVQFSLDSDGNLLFSNHSDNNTFTGISRPINLLLNNDSIQNIYTLSESINIEVQLFQTDENGQNSQKFSYSYLGVGSFGAIRHAILTDHNSLFTIATIRPPFPDPFSNTLYLQWTADGLLCNQEEVDGISGLDSSSENILQAYQQNIYELRTIKDSITGVNFLHVVKHLNISECLSDFIFSASFEN